MHWTSILLNYSIAFKFVLMNVIVLLIIHFKPVVSVSKSDLNNEGSLVLLHYIYLPAFAAYDYTGMSLAYHHKSVEILGLNLAYM